MRGISPVYGGGTPNASFEMFTGLPTINPAVSSILYHQYRDYFADKSSTLPSHLAANGYQTISAHNYSSDFWSRNVVELKLGFQYFYGLQHMHPNFDWIGFPEDTVLYPFAFDQLKDNQDKPLFMHLATVETHGPYPAQNEDGGASNYLHKVGKSVASLTAFLDEVQQAFPEAVILVYGDHKPALGLFRPLLDQGRSVIGDVPVLLYDPLGKRAERFKRLVDGKPFYCFAGAISKIYFGMDLPVSAYTKKGCETFEGASYDLVSASVPAWVYSASVFSEALK